MQQTNGPIIGAETRNKSRTRDISTKLHPKVLQTHEKLIGSFLRLSPGNKSTVLMNKYVQTIKLTANLKYNLAWTYGFFMFEIPRHMNENEALDAAVNALVCAHSNFCTRSEVSAETLRSYSHALRSLRKSLDNSNTASAPETLCAIMLLLICQVSDKYPDKK